MVPEDKAPKVRGGKESRVESIDYTALEEAIKEADKKPKLGVYSPLAAAILRYKAITTPRYSMGSELRAVIEEALKETYPLLYREVQRKMKIPETGAVGVGVISQESRVQRGESYNSEILKRAMSEAGKNPRVSLWIPKSAAVLKYMKKTQPEFSISEEASALLDEAIRRKYPRLMEEIEKL